MRHEARCNAPADPTDPSKGTNRDWWRASARKGKPVAIRALAGPPFPEELEYLYRWALALHGRSGVGMNGYAPLSPPVIESWARLTNYQPNAMDVEALFQIDAALSAGATEPDGAADEPQTERVDRPWPAKKGASDG